MPLISLYWVVEVSELYFNGALTWDVSKESNSLSFKS